MRASCMRGGLRAAAISLAVILLATGAHAQTGGGFDLRWNVVPGGGASSSSGAYKVTGSGGQPDAGQVSGGAWKISGGFWWTRVTATDVPSPAAGAPGRFHL